MGEPTTKLTTIGVIGAGTMGSGIALAGLFAGLTVRLYDIAPEMLEQAEAYIKKFLARKDKESAADHLSLSTNLADLAGVEVVIEAALERLDIKQQIFGKLDTICPPPAILASNTSTLAVTEIAAATVHPDRVAGMHFFNPAPVLPLVEVAQAAQTSEETVQTLVALSRQMGKTPVVTKDRPGFIVNRVARPFYLEALRLVGEGVASHEQIDHILQLGGGFRMGPFQLMDLIGIDINFAAAHSMYEQTFGEPRYRPHFLQTQKMQQNALGRKSGQGFYTYGPEASPIEKPSPPPRQSGSGAIWLAAGDWAPGLVELCEKTGYTASDAPDEIPVVGLMTSGHRGIMQDIFDFDETLPPEVPLLCQTADCTVSEIATWLDHPQRLVGFDGLFVGSGEVATLVASPVLAEDIREKAEAFFAGLGRHVIWLEESPALVLPRIIAALVNEAAFAAGEGLADQETIDTAMKLGVNYPKGLFEWGRELGYRKVVAILDHLHAETGEPRYRVAPLLRRLGRLGQINNRSTDLSF